MRASITLIAYASASFLISFLILLAVYTRYPILYGIDGPYYIIQLEHLASKGVIKYPDPPLTYYLLLPFYLLSSDKNLGLKIAVAFYGGLTSLLLYLSFRRFSDLSGLAASLTFTISPYTLRLANDFLKNYVSLIFVAIFIYTILNEEKPSRALIFSSLAAVAVALSHVLTYGVFALLALLIFIASVLIRDNSLKVMRYGAAGAAGTSFLLLAIALTVAPSIVGYDTAKLLSFLENPFKEGSADLMRANFIASLTIGVGGFIYGFFKRSKLSPLIIGSSILLILLNTPMLESSWLFRFSLMTSILIPPIAAVIVGEAGPKARFTTLLLIIGLMIMVTLPVIHVLRPSISMGEYSELQEISKHVPPGSSILIPSIRLRYWVEAIYDDQYTFITKPQKPLAQIQNTYLIAEKGRTPIRIPPRARIVFDGRYLLITRIG
ncbi:MAG: hypothetical protein DRN59_00570 [Thaumarchaeota archaeon]|nr:MAG: hypothetical protein DRN59_00570 [Nitrososphaerota archaeon]